MLMKKNKIKLKIFLLIISFILFLSFLGLGSIILAQKILPHEYQIKLIQAYPSLMSTLKITKTLDIFDFYAYFQKSKLPVYYLSISQKNLDKLEKDPKNNVKANFTYGDKAYKVKIKHKGFDKKHLAFKKKSWTILFDKEELFLDKYTKISFTVPVDRRYLVEELNMYRARKMDMLVPDTWMGELNINGKNSGVYFINQNFDQNFLALNQRYDQANLYQADLDYYGKIYKDINKWDKYVNEESSPINNHSDVYQLLEILKLNDQDFLQNIFNIIDKDNFYKWAVHALMTHSQQQDYLHNLRAYFDPTKGKFEFIPWDVLIYEPHADIDVDYNPLLTRVLLIPEFMHQRNTYLWDYVKDENNLQDDLAYYDKLTEDTAVGFKQDRVKQFSNKAVANYIKLYREFLIEIYKNNRKAFDYIHAWAMVHTGQNQDPNILSKLDLEIEAFAAQTINEISFAVPEVIDGEYKLILDNNNNNQLDTADKIIGQSSYDKEKKIYYFKDIPFTFHTKRKIPGYEILNSQKAPFKFEKTTYGIFISGTNNNGKISDVKIKLKNYFTKDITKLEVKYIYSELFQDFRKINLTQEEFLNSNNDYFYLDQDKIKVKKDVIITRDIIIPKNITVTMEPGTNLLISPKKSLISYGKIIAEGLKDQPITIKPVHQDNPWGVFGLVGENANGSTFNYILVENGSQTQINGIFFSGQFAAHFSDIEIKNSIFRFANGDDAVNIKNSKVHIENSYFAQNKFDAIDLDFNPEGIVKNCIFENNGNDSIDLGGTENIRIISNLIINSGDKGISIGENSQNITIINNTVIKSNIGIAIKDLSDPIVINNTLTENNIGISSYEKKSIFGDAKGTIYNSLIYRNKKNLELLKGNETNLENNFNIIENKNVEFIDPANYNYLIKNSNNKGNNEILNKYIKTDFSVTPVGIYQNTNYQKPFNL